MPTGDPECWHLTAHGRTHRVEVVGTGLRTVRWHLDGHLVTEKQTAQDSIQLEAGADGDLAIRVRFNALGGAKRVTLYQRDGELGSKARAVLGSGGIDLDPEPGSRADLRLQRIRRHPRRHAAIATATGV